MMNRIAVAALAITTFVAVSAFKKNKDEGKYTIDMSKSGIIWEGNKAIGGGHTGTISLKEGTINFNGETITSGTFTADMNSITNIDLDNNIKDKLVNHLKSADFFEVEKYPTATFVITKVEPVSAGNAMATGSLTIKGVTNNITFPFTYHTMGNRLEVTAKKLKIDRTKYGIQFASKGLKSSMSDKVINDEFLLDLNLVFIK